MDQYKRSTKEDQPTFAVTSLGRNRWYWVVWPSLAQLQSGKLERHVADGYTTNKADAVDQALAAAGIYGRWVAAKFARQYHRQRQQTKRVGDEEEEHNTVVPTVQTFLYRDVQDPETGYWVSIPYRVIKRTARYVYVERHPYSLEQLTGSWADFEAKTYRLDRQMLEQAGYAFLPLLDGEDPLFFSTPYAERVDVGGDAGANLLAVFSDVSSIEEMKSIYRRLARRFHPDRGGTHQDFLALQSAYKRALQLLRGGDGERSP